MMHNSTALYDALHKCVVDLDKQIEAMKQDLEQQIADLPSYPEEVSIYEMKNRDGSFVLADIIIARTNALASMANLKAADTQARIKR